jgi:hypothetical protein
MFRPVVCKYYAVGLLWDVIHRYKPDFIRMAGFFYCYVIKSFFVTVMNFK